MERGTPAIRQESVPAAPWLENVLVDARNGRGVEAPRIEIRARVEVDSVRCEPRYMARAVVNRLRLGLDRLVVLRFIRYDGYIDFIHSRVYFLFIHHGG